MKSQSFGFILRSLVIQCVSLLLALALLAAPICAQRPAAPAKAPATRRTQRAPEPTFDNLLAADSYKLYGEVRNIGQLMSTGGAGEIVDPIIKLADPPKEFKSIIKFLKTNAEALATARLLFATWPARTDVPNAFVAIEFATNEEAAKFAPKLETFLPTVLPPVPEPRSPESTAPSGPAKAKPTEPGRATSGRPNLRKKPRRPRLLSARNPTEAGRALPAVCDYPHRQSGSHQRQVFQVRKAPPGRQQVAFRRSKFSHCPRSVLV